MKKKIKAIALPCFIAIIAIITIIAISNIYKWIVSGKQTIKISTSSKAFTNSDLYISVIAQDKNVDLETKTKVKLLNSKGKKVKNTKVTYENNTAKISIPDIEAGNYFIEAHVSSKKGKDIVRKAIYLSNGNQENVTINFDKGIYKPGDTINYRVLLTSKENDKPINENTNISIYDGNDNRVYNEDIKTSEYGILSGNFKLADEINSGLYKLIVKTDASETTKQFKVNPYVTPKYEVEIKLDKNNYIVGDIAKLNIDSKYFFGEVASGTQYTVYIDGKEYQKVLADNAGHASIEYEIKEAKTFNIKVEAVDTSNYYIEANTSFSAGTDLFEINILPEFGTLIANKKNDIYVFTSKADGTPVKTYITVTSDEFTKQVATDDNGIGKFSIDIDSIEKYKNYSRETNYKRTKQFTFTAENMNKEKISKTKTVEIENKDLLLATDKVKYEQGEDIKLNVHSLTEGNKNIYFIKNEKIIKMLTTDSEDTTINLGDNYGLVDIYISDGMITNNYTYSQAYNGYSRKNYFKRTIFIKPNKQLNIGISTDKDEYKPGDKINISFDVNNENKDSVDAALLVSMLDNSILSLADNDLSIDNIKLALSDITFSDEIDAATLYSCIVDDKSEQSIMALLLKQSDKDLNISETTKINYEEEEKAKNTAIILISVLAYITLMYLTKFKKFRRFLGHALNWGIFTITTIISSIYVFDDVLNLYIIEYSIPAHITIAIICLTIYIAGLSRIYKNIIRTSITILILTILAYLFKIIYSIVDYYEFSAYWIIIPIVVGICAFILYLKGSKRKFAEKIRGKVQDELTYICKLIFAVIFSIIIAALLRIPIAFIIALYPINYKLNIKKKGIKENIKWKSIATYIILTLAALGLVGIGVIITYVLGRSGRSMNTTLSPQESTSSSYSNKYSNNYNTRMPTSGQLDPGSYVGNEFKGSATTNEGRSGLLDSIFEGAQDQASKVMPNSKAPKTVESDSEEYSILTEEKDTNIDNKIRNVFLESMCFIPEVITENGKASLDLTLSDNITTWTIQTVGNTKDGRIGYGSLDTVKVFKEFFVDFELPKNLIESDEVSIPVTVYNYTDNTITTSLKINEGEWFKFIESNTFTVEVAAKSSKMIYIPIQIIKFGDYKFRAEASNNSVSDIIEKEITISPKGYKIEKVVSTGKLEEDISEDILILDNIIENTAKAKVKIYASPMAQSVEGMENIFKMPTGCFEQVSSSLYPNILALKYMQDNGIIKDEIKSKALSYISSGYQKLLAYEVRGEKGGYSLYGHSPAETVLTAYGLMELTDLKDVYKVDENVLKNMNSFLYSKQNSDGSFNITGSHLGGAGSRNKITLNAYIIWALSESNSNEPKLEKSVKYLKNNLDKINDNYTLALIANVLANVKDKEVDKAINKLVNNVKVNGNTAYVTSNTIDYYGSRGKVQDTQTVALTSMALSKTSKNNAVNKQLINYLISSKDTRGTWYSTQATILCLKALNEANEKNNLDNQTIKVKINSNEQEIKINGNALDIYQLTFDNLTKENKLSIDMEKGSAYYEVIEEYYIPYENVETSNNIEINLDANANLKVNDILNAKIKLINQSKNDIYNGMITISIPQGFVTMEESLMDLETKGIIEKYETSYTSVNIYLRNFEMSKIVDLFVKFRAAYPVNITGLQVRAYDYYNPEVEGISTPININVNK